MATTHDASVIEGICSGQPQLSNASTYLAAVLNLTAPTDFVLGDGSRGQGWHNAALRPGCDYTALLLLARLSPQVPIPCSLGMLPAGAGPLAGPGLPGRAHSSPVPRRDGVPALPGSLGGPGWALLPPGGVVLHEWAQLSLLSPPTGREVHLCLLQLLCW